jgi:hypothetical protein
MENLMYRQLQQFVENRTFVDLYMDQWDETIWGYIHSFTDEFLLLEKFNTDCQPNGISVLQRDSITRFRWDNNETRAGSLIAGKKSPMTGLEDIQLTSVYTILGSVEEMFGHLTVYTEHIDKSMLMIGTIHEMDTEHVLLEEYGTRVTLASRGRVLLPLQNITRVEAGGIYENSLLHTARNRQQLQ